MKKIAMLSLVVCTNLLTSVSFAVELVTNGSFENPTPDSSWLPSPDGTYRPGSFTGWTSSGQSGVWQPAPAMFNSIPDGRQVGWASDVNTGGSLTQVISHTISTGEVLTLSGSIGDRSNLLSGYGAGTSGSIILYTNTNVSILGAALFASGTTGNWATFSASTAPGYLDAYAGMSLYIVLSSPTGSQASFDNISVQSVPEPSSLATLAVLGLTFARKRKSK